MNAQSINIHARLIRILTAGTLLLCGFLLLFASASPVPDPALLPWPSEAAGRFGLAYQQQRYSTEPLLRSIEPHLTRGEWGLAADTIEKALERDPGNARLRVVLADLWQRQGDWERVSALSAELLEQHPDYVAAHWLKGNAAFARKEFSNAAHELEMFLADLSIEDPRRSSVLTLLSRATLEAGQLDAAERYANEWITRDDTLEAREILLTCAVRRGRWNAARPHVEAALRLAGQESERGPLHLQAGYILMAQGLFDLAEQELIRAGDQLAGPIHQQEVRRLRGQIAFRRGEFAQAARHFKGCLLDTFDEQTAGSFLAALSQSHQWPIGVIEAHDLLHRQEISPAFRDELRRQLLGFYKAQEDYASCYAMARQFYLESHDTAYLLELAQLAEKTGHVDDALRLFEAHTDTPGDTAGAAEPISLLKKTKPGN